MGSKLSQLISNLSKNYKIRILLVGLNETGKTAMMHRLKLEPYPIAKATVGYNFETIEYRSIRFNVWDVGYAIQPLWHNYLQNADGLIFMVDSSDRERVSMARDRLHEIMKNERMQDVPLLVLANKQDLDNCMTVNEVTDALGLKVFGVLPWYVQAACVTTCDGVYEGFDWLISKLKPEASN